MAEKQVFLESGFHYQRGISKAGWGFGLERSW